MRAVASIPHSTLTRSCLQAWNASCFEAFLTRSPLYLSVAAFHIFSLRRSSSIPATVTSDTQFILLSLHKPLYQKGIQYGKCRVE